MAGQAAQVKFDVKSFEANLRKAVATIKATTEDGLVGLGQAIQSDARRYCPVDTGRLRASIMASGVQHDHKGAFIEIGTNVTYAAFVEFGTRHQQAQPYLRPAFLTGIRRFNRAMAAAARKAEAEIDK